MFYPSSLAHAWAIKAAASSRRRRFRLSPQNIAHRRGTPWGMDFTNSVRNFFRVFSAQNGFVLRKMVLYESWESDAPCIQVNNPAITGLRTELFPKTPMTLSVLAKRVESVPLFARPPLQSDYVACWENHHKVEESKAPQRGLNYEIRKNKFVLAFLASALERELP